MQSIKALLLAAGFGTRLKPLTDIWPKCLMPIQDRPLLEYWLGIFHNLEINEVLVNTHYFSKHVETFLNQSHFSSWVSAVHERKLLGTAGTIRKNANLLVNSTLLLAHADNWTCCNFSDFTYYHQNQRPKGTVITMMTFMCPDPSMCGIVKLDCNGIVVDFYEKVKNPPGNLANAAVYLIEPEVVEWIVKHQNISDFSTEVLPKFIGRIATWENREIHKDIGTPKMLMESQMDKCEKPIWSKNNPWQQEFLNNPIHSMVSQIV